MEGEMKKFVYEDNRQIKVIKGRILKEDEFTYTIEAINTKATIVLGKRAVIKVSKAGEYDE